MIVLECNDHIRLLCRSGFVLKHLTQIGTFCDSPGDDSQLFTVSGTEWPMALAMAGVAFHPAMYLSNQFFS